MRRSATHIPTDYPEGKIAVYTDVDLATLLPMEKHFKIATLKLLQHFCIDLGRSYFFHALRKEAKMFHA